MENNRFLVNQTNTEDVRSNIFLQSYSNNGRPRIINIDKSRANSSAN